MVLVYNLPGAPCLRVDRESVKFRGCDSNIDSCLHHVLDLLDSLQGHPLETHKSLFELAARRLRLRLFGAFVVVP
jgi:hypothetical protein